MILLRTGRSALGQVRRRMTFPRSSRRAGAWKASCVSVQSLVHPVRARCLLSAMSLAGSARSSLLACPGGSLAEPITVPFRGWPGKSRVARERGRGGRMHAGVRDLLHLAWRHRGASGSDRPDRRGPHRAGGEPAAKGCTGLGTRPPSDHYAALTSLPRCHGVWSRLIRDLYADPPLCAPW